MSKISSAQLRVLPSGNVGMGIDPGNPGYKCLIKGDLLLTTYPEIPQGFNRFLEFKFKVGNGFPAEFGASLGNIAVWSAEVGFNNFFANHYYVMSDSTFKTNIIPIPNGLETVLQLKPYSFYVRDTLGGEPSP